MGLILRIGIEKNLSGSTGDGGGDFLRKSTNFGVFWGLEENLRQEDGVSNVQSPRSKVQSRFYVSGFKLQVSSRPKRRIIEPLT